MKQAELIDWPVFETHYAEFFPSRTVAESFFQLLKRERIRRKVYLDQEEAKRDVFNCIEMFYHPKCRHGHGNDVSPVQFENKYFNRLRSV